VHRLAISETETSNSSAKSGYRNVAGAECRESEGETSEVEGGQESGGRMSTGECKGGGQG